MKLLTIAILLATLLTAACKKDIVKPNTTEADKVKAFKATLRS